MQRAGVMRCAGRTPPRGIGASAVPASTQRIGLIYNHSDTLKGGAARIGRVICQVRGPPAALSPLAPSRRRLTCEPRALQAARGAQQPADKDAAS